MNWNSLTLDEFQSSLASKSATPGGGTASAVASVSYTHLTLPTITGV